MQKNNKIKLILIYGYLLALSILFIGCADKIENAQHQIRLRQPINISKIIRSKVDIPYFRQDPTWCYQTIGRSDCYKSEQYGQEYRWLN